MAATRSRGHRVIHGLVGSLIPATAFVAVVTLGLSMATMLPYTAHARGGCTECVHDVNHWTCGASNADDRMCVKSSAALCMNVVTDCVGSTTAISGGGFGDGSDLYTISTTGL